MHQASLVAKASLLGGVFVLLTFAGCIGNQDESAIGDYAPMDLPEDQGPQSVVAKMSLEGTLMVGELLSVKDLSTVKNDKITSRVWEFSDGASDVGTSAMHAFETAGTHSVKLTVGTESGLTDYVRTNLKVVAEPVDNTKLAVNFTYQTDSLKAIFSPIVSGAKDQLYYHWTFGDGTTSSLPGPVHYYESAGSFRVTLEVMERNGDTLYAVSYVEVVYEDPGAGEGGQGRGGVGDDGAHRDQAGEYTDGGGLPPLMVEIGFENEGLQFDFYPVVINGLGSDISYSWELGDGDFSNQEKPLHAYAEYKPYWVELNIVSSDGRTASDLQMVEPTIEIEFEPHVVVGIPDTGINPYHLSYYRPNRIHHPCEYLEGYPCSIQELPLTIGTTNWAAAFNADQQLWADVQPGVWYWIPQTVFVAVMCDAPFDPGNGDICIFDDSHPHGTGTTSSVLTEAPEALISFVEFAPQASHWVNDGIPVDIVSVSWRSALPLPPPAPNGGVRPYPAFDGDNCGVNDDIRSVNIYFKSSGNEPGASAMQECWSGSPYLISVGGGQAADKTRTLMAYTEPDIVSYYCRPVYSTMAATGWDETCGTSFACPTAAGAMAKVILGIRKASGYLGNIEGDYYSEGHGMVDPLYGVSVQDLREAMNLTASYDPVPEYPNTGDIAINEEEPWIDWAWGFFDGTVADATLGHILGSYDAPPKPVEAVTFMAERDAQKQEWYG